VVLDGLVRVRGGQGLRLQVDPALTYAFDASGHALRRLNAAPLSEAA
jgi:hypothetical protein